MSFYSCNCPGCGFSVLFRYAHGGADSSLCVLCYSPSPRPRVMVSCSNTRQQYPIYKSLNLRACVCMLACIYIYVCVRACVRACVCACVRACVRACVSRTGDRRKTYHYQTQGKFSSISKLVTSPTVPTLCKVAIAIGNLATDNAMSTLTGQGSTPSCPHQHHYHKHRLEQRISRVEGFI